MTNGNLLGSAVLVLNASYEPIHVCVARRALILLFKGVAASEEVADAEVHSPSVTVPLPSVIRLLEYRRIPLQTRSLSRKNILVRDGHICQYCERPFSGGELTLDHVTPRSRGGSSSWENLVACCRGCNNRKGNRLPEEANMSLVRRPRPFNLHTSRSLMRLFGNQREAWRKYLFY